MSVRRGIEKARESGSMTGTGLALMIMAAEEMIYWRYTVNADADTNVYGYGFFTECAADTA